MPCLCALGATPVRSLLFVDQMSIVFVAVCANKFCTMLNESGDFVRLGVSWTEDMRQANIAVSITENFAEGLEGREEPAVRSIKKTGVRVVIVLAKDNGTITVASQATQLGNIHMHECMNEHE